METTTNKGKWGFAAISIPVMIWTLLPLVWIFALSLKRDSALSDPGYNRWGNF